MIIQTKEQLKYFLDEIKDSSFFIEAIPSNWNDPIQVVDLIVLYIYVLSVKKSFILVFNHSEKFHDIYDTSIISKLNNDERKYTFNKKNILHFFKLNNLCDLTAYSYLNYTLKELNFDKSYIYTYFKNDNYFVPLLKHKEYYDNNIKKNYSKIFKKENINADSYYIYNNIIDDVVELEKNPIKVEDIDKYFPKKNIKVFDNKIYSNYNLYTTTQRPTNSHNGLNLLALNKTNGEREAIISNLDYLLEFDFNSFHFRLITDKVLNIDLSSEDDLYAYFSKDFSINEEREEVKKIVFQLLYSGYISEKYKKNKFFYLVDKLQDKLYDSYIENGFIETLLFKRKLKVQGTINKGKLFNYYIQSLETENNLLIINKLNDLLKDYKTKLILYVYDAFLFDFAKKEKELINKIKSILKYKVHTKIGKNYNELNEILMLKETT